MNQKYDDYEKTLAVIKSCRTSRQNMVAYRMIWNFSSKHKDDHMVQELFYQCDINLIDISNKRR